MESLVLVFSFELSSLITGVRLKTSIQSQFKTWHQFLVIDGGIKSIVSVPLLGQLESLLLAAVLGLQASSNLSTVKSCVSPSGEFDAVSSSKLFVTALETK